MAGLSLSGIGLGLRARPPSRPWLTTFKANLLGEWDARDVVAVDGASVASVPNRVSGGTAATQAVSGHQPVMHATAWSDGGPALRFTTASVSYLSIDALAHLYGSTGQAFSIALLVRLTSTGGGCLAGFGSAAGVNAQYGLSGPTPQTSKNGGPQGTKIQSAPTWMHVWKTDDLTPATDSLIVYSVDPSGAQFVWYNGQRYVFPIIGVDPVNPYNNLSIGALLMAGSTFQAASFDLRAVYVHSGAATRKRISALVQYTGRSDLGRSDLLCRPIRIDGNSRTAGNGVGFPWPHYLTASLLPRDIGRKASNNGPGQALNAAVGGEAIQDVQTPTSPPPDGNTGYEDSQSATNVYAPFAPATASAIYGNPGVLLGIGGASVDENSVANYDADCPPILVMGDPFHDIWRGYTAAQVLARMASAIAQVRVAAPNAYVVALDCLPGEAPGFQAFPQATATAFNALFAAQGCGADLHIPWSTCPGMTTARGGGYQSETGGTVWVHPVDNGAHAQGSGALADFVASYLPQIHAAAAAQELAQMTAAAG